MAKKNARANDEVDGKVNLSPMIDCCFLLLIFFVVNATQITVSKDPSVKMPSAVSCSELKDAKGCIVINIFPDEDKMKDAARKKFNDTYKSYPGTIWGVSDNGNSVGYSAAQESDLVEFLKKQVDQMKNRKIDPAKIRIYLRGDQAAPWERTRKAIRAAGQAGMTNIVFGTLPAKN